MKDKQLKLQLKDLDDKTLRELALKLDVFLFKNDARNGEDFHRSYKVDEKIFKTFLKQSVQFKDNIHAFFLDQLSRIDRLVNFYKIQADDYLNDTYWTDEDGTLSATLEIDLEKFFDAGAVSTMIELKVDIDLSAKNTPQAKFLRDYSLKLAKDINATTKDRLKGQIQTSIKIGENRDALTARLTAILDNEKRATMIAQTESVRAFSEGRLAVGKALGWKYKMWRISPGACPICLKLNGQVAKIEEPFSIGVQVPPAHPNCRCGHKLIQALEQDQELDVEGNKLIQQFAR